MPPTNLGFTIAFGTVVRYLKQLHASGQRSAAITGLSALVDECRSKGWAKQDVPMMVRVYLRLGLWNLELSEEYVSPAIRQRQRLPATYSLLGVLMVPCIFCAVMLQVCDS